MPIKAVEPVSAPACWRTRIYFFQAHNEILTMIFGSEPLDEAAIAAEYNGYARRLAPHLADVELVILYHARRSNSLTDLIVTTLDILRGLEQIPVCVAYDLDGERISHILADLKTLARCRPIYENLPGWHEDITRVRLLADLPANAQNYVGTISERTGIAISLVSVGPGREQSIVVNQSDG